MQVKKFPQAWVKASTGKKVESRIDMSAEVVGSGNCPECKKPMQEVSINGTKMWACASDRITIPLPNEGQSG